MPATQITGPWGHRTLSLDAARKRTWFREFFGAALASRSIAASGSGLDRGALAAAFWQWAEMLDAEPRFENVDPCDFTHYAAGQLLRCLLTHRPLRLPDRQRSEEVRAMTQTVLSVLREWRCALDVQTGFAAARRQRLALGRLPGRHSPRCCVSRGVPGQILRPGA